MVEGLREERLLARAGFGAAPGEAEALRPIGARAWLEEQLAAGSDPDSDPELERRLRAFPGLDVDPLELARELDGPSMLRSQEGRAELRERTRDVAGDVVGARLVRAVHGRWPLREVMIDFWSNHFSVYARKAFVGLLLPPHQRDVIERHALGRFEDLLIAVARSPAMLVYLDNHVSMAPQGRWARRRPLRERGLNENYARELLELHTLGVDGGYTQADVVETARVLTGWGLRGRREPVFAFHERLHDPGAKHVLGERVRGEGFEEGVGLLRRLARHPSTARHLARKLVTRFVSDQPPPRLVEEVARLHLERDGRIPDLLRAILLSPEFADPERRKLKTPLRFAVGAVRTSGGETDGGWATLREIGRLGELPYLSRTPDGFPEEAHHWIDAGALLERFGLAFALARGRVPGTRLGGRGGDRDAGGLDDWERRALALAAPEFQWA
jgi:uncharacterized protein (DUF1800 family)